jgi:hypothetical protein
VEASGLGHGSAASQPADTFKGCGLPLLTDGCVDYCGERSIYLFIYFSKYECFALPVVTAMGKKKKKKDLIRYSAKIFIRFVLVLDVDEGGNVLQT